MPSYVVLSHTGPIPRELGSTQSNRSGAKHGSLITTKANTHLSLVCIEASKTKQPINAPTMIYASCRPLTLFSVFSTSAGRNSGGKFFIPPIRSGSRSWSQGAWFIGQKLPHDHGMRWQLAAVWLRRGSFSRAASFFFSLYPSRFMA